MIISTVVASLLLGGSLLQASSEKSIKNISNIEKHQKSKKIIEKEIQTQTQTQNFKNAPKEIMLGLNSTFNAIKSLEQNNTDAAKKSLVKATKEFNTALKADPALGLVPVKNDIQISELDSGLKEIMEELKLAEDALEDYNTQVARELLMPLKDDVVITTRSIPMDIYPVATKKALDELNKGNKDAALEELMAGLSMIVTKRVVIPISLLAAQDLIVVASELDKADKKVALGLLQDAKDQLKKAVLLGYTNKYSAEYKALSKEIKAIKKEIKGKNEVQKLYDRTKEFFGSLLHKTRTDQDKEKTIK